MAANRLKTPGSLLSMTFKQLRTIVPTLKSRDVLHDGQPLQCSGKPLWQLRKKQGYAILQKHKSALMLLLNQESSASTKILLISGIITNKIHLNRSSNFSSKMLNPTTIKYNFKSVVELHRASLQMRVIMPDMTMPYLQNMLIPNKRMVDYGKTETYEWTKAYEPTLPGSTGLRHLFKDWSGKDLEPIMTNCFHISENMKIFVPIVIPDWV